MRRVLGGAAALAVAAAAWSYLARGGSTVATTTVHREDLPLTVEASGELDAARSSLIGPPLVPNMWEFKISFMVPESRVVRKGDPILGFDATAMESERQKRKVEYDVAIKEIEKRDADLALQVADLEQQLDEAESRLGKSAMKADVPEDLAASVDLRLSQLDRELAGKEVASLKIRVEEARRAGQADLEGLVRKRDHAASRMDEIQKAIARMRVAAPQDGIVIYQADNQGEKRKVGDSVWGALKVLKIPDLSEMMGRADVDEPEAGSLRTGDPVTIRLDALPDAAFEGRLSSIGRVVQQASRGSALKVYKVEFSLDRTDPARMRPGMRLRADIEVERIPGALVVRQEAITLHPSGPVLFVRKASGFEERPVRLGRRNARLVEILEGAAEGEIVALQDPSRAGAASSDRPGGPSS
jgi:multidrug efflux pump subunit AcrA (membrane-fusion protein)